MSETPSPSVFDSAYREYSAPWVIGEPQPTVIDLERSGWIRGDVLDIGCGAGEHTIHLARLGYNVEGIDSSAPAIEHAVASAARAGVGARFSVRDAMQLSGVEYDTVLDSALFHIFDDRDRIRYVESLSRICRPGGLLLLLALSDEGPGFGPEVSEDVIREAFREGWAIEDLVRGTYEAVATADRHVDELGLERNQRVSLPAWVARIRRLAA